MRKKFLLQGFKFNQDSTCLHLLPPWLMKIEHWNMGISIRVGTKQKSWRRSNLISRIRKVFKEALVHSSISLKVIEGTEIKILEAKRSSTMEPQWGRQMPLEPSFSPLQHLSLKPYSLIALHSAMWQRENVIKQSHTSQQVNVPALFQVT